MQQSLGRNSSNISSVVKILDLMDRYDLFLLDIWGVIIEGDGTYPNAVEAVNYLIAHKKVVFVSNVPRTIESTGEMLKGYGVNVLPEMIVTSGDLTRKFLANSSQHLNIPSPLLYNLGLARHYELWHGLDIPVVNDIEKANLLMIVINIASKDIEPSSYDLLQQAALLKIPAICANNDKVYAHSGQIIYCAGHFAEKFEEFGGKVWYMGKPFAPIFEEALSKHPEVEKQRILMIGDTIDTDIVGASNIGINSALVTTGNIGFQLSGSQNKFLAVRDLCAQQNVCPDHIISLDLSKV
jgi:HAD superfamily hydrolase (TIGR01459 family)